MGRVKDNKPHPNMEQILNYIGRRYISVDAGKKRSANQDLNNILLHVTNAIKNVSPLFRSLFKIFLYAGSSYDGLKIGKPDEFDIDFQLFLPGSLDVQVFNSDKHGFVHIWLKNWEILKKNKLKYAKYRELEEFIDEKHYLSHVKIKEWMQSIVTKAINNLNLIGIFEPMQVNHKTSGPAVTLVITNTKNEMTVDLVPVFRIENSKWPEPPVKPNIYNEIGYLVVPKAPKALDKPLGQNLERYWRLSFPQQEMVQMNNHNFLKPTLRCLKKLRDTRSHNIPSYFIKTIFLWEIDKHPKNFWKQSATTVLIEMLKKYKDYLQNRQIPYFWDGKFNLIETLTTENVDNIFNYLERMINDIDNLRYTHPIIIAKYLLSEKDYLKVCKELNVTVI